LRSFFDRVELLLNVAIEYKTTKTIEWENYRLGIMSQFSNLSGLV